MALFERAVGYYSDLINVNAYHQPGVEAGKKAAGEVIKLQAIIVDFINENKQKAHTAGDIAAGLNISGREEDVYLICQHLSANPDRGIKKAFTNIWHESTFQRG